MTAVPSVAAFLWVRLWATVCASTSLPLPLRPIPRPSAAMSSTFWFPSMSVGEIVESFTGWGYSISPEQVARPTSDFVLGVYAACLSRVTGISIEILQDAAEPSLSATDNPVRSSSSQKSSRHLNRPSCRTCTPKHSPIASCSTICTFY